MLDILKEFMVNFNAFEERNSRTYNLSRDDEQKFMVVDIEEYEEQDDNNDCGN